MLGLLDNMRLEGILADSFTFVQVVKLMTGESGPARVQKLLEDAKVLFTGLALSNVYSAVILSYGSLSRYVCMFVGVGEMLRFSGMERDTGGRRGEVASCRLCPAVLVLVFHSVGLHPKNGHTNEALYS